MIYLDSHIVVWFYSGNKRPFSDAIRQLMNAHDWLISPIVRLEMQYLFEIGRISVPADEIIAQVAHGASLTICNKPFDDIVATSLRLSWTRDPFDRLLVAHASLNDDILITADQNIRDNYSLARW